MFYPKDTGQALVDQDQDQSTSMMEAEQQPIQIPKIEDSETDKMQPNDIYLESCKVFAYQNLKYDVLNIEPITFTQNHIKEGILAENLTESEIKRYNFLARVSEAGSRYINVGIWNFMEILFISYGQSDEKDLALKKQQTKINGVTQTEQKQHMVIKTWEQHQCQVPPMLSEFYVKTIRIYDLQNKLLDTILVEKIEGNFSGDNIYDTSIISFNSKLYYFKRVWTQLEQDGGPKDQSQSALLQDSQIMSEEGSPLKGKSSLQITAQYNTDQTQKQGQRWQTRLELYSYDLQTQREELCKDREGQAYTIQESVSDGHVHQDGSITHNLNVTFSKEFGKTSANEDFYRDEIEFLERQYVCTQAYIEKSDNKEFNLYCLKDLSKELHSCQARTSNDPNHVDHNTFMTKQIQSLNHIVTDNNEESEKTIVFILINIQSHIHFHYNPKTGSVSTVKFDGQNIFHKSLNSYIEVQKLNISYNDEDNVLQHVQQFFFVDNNNQIQLLYPNFVQKSQKFFVTDIVSSDAKIGQQDSRYFKKINRVHAKTSGPAGDQIQTEACAKDNTTQDIEHLRKILNFKTITKDQVFTFCSDNQDQILYITQAIEPKVIVIQVKDNHSEECWDNLANESQKKILYQFGQRIGKQMAQKDHSLKQLRKQTRMKSLANALNQRIPQKIELMCSEEQNNDIITIDINTQEVIVTRNEEAKKARNINDNNSKEASDIDIPQISRISQQDVTNSPEVLNQTGKNFTIIEADFGVDHKIKIQNLFDEEVDQNEQLNVEITQKNENNYIFILSAVSFIEEIKKVSYFIVKKSIEEVEKLINSGLEVTQDEVSMDGDQMGSYQQNEGKYLLNANDDIKIIVGPNLGDGLETIKFKDIGKFKLEGRVPNQNLTFEKFVDPNVAINFLALVYQESFHNKNNYMLIIDIDTCEIRKKIPVNPNAINQRYMYVDAQGFNSFKICRTSDVDYRTREVPGTWCKKPKTYYINETIYKIFTIYVEKLGRIQAQEFLITHDEEQIEIQAIGQNQMMMSKECIQNSDWNHIKNSVVLPFHFYDRSGVVKNIGCQFLLNREKGKPIQINMIDRMHNNLYIYMSQLLLVGQKRFQINRNDQSDYLIIISARITDEIIEKKIFEQYETYSLLRGAQEIMIEMRRPDLEYILLNTFQNLKENDFFVSQEMLLGKSICDISLSDPRSVREALANYKQDKSNINCSIVFELIKGDELRKEAFQEIKFYPKNQVIKYDFNFDTTINMGLRMQSIKSVTLLLNFIIDEINTLEYYDLIMLDLHEIFEAKIINLNSFFSESASEQINTVGATQITGCQEERKALGYCNVEIPIESEELVIFSDKAAQFETISSFENIHEIEDELVDYINKRQEEDDKNGDMENSKEIEHSYIDLKFLIIGDKIKHMYEEEEFNDLKYDDEYLSGLIMSTDNNNEFYMQESVQKIIDYQFQQTQKGMTYLFWFYIICYIIPYSVTLVSENVTVHLYVLRICVIPQLVLLIIELIQMKENGLDYIQGWNLIDLMQIIVFFFMFSTVQANAMREGMTDADGNMIPEQEEIHSPFLPFIKIQLVALSFAKTLHFITVYEDLGFFVIMVQRSFIDLIPFIMSYLFFQCFWATVFAVLKVEIDGEVASGVGLGYFGSLFLMVWRNSTGKLGLQTYSGLNHMPKSALLYVNIELIWLAYFAQIIFMLVIMLNFIIAIIDQTYVAVNKNKNIFVYMNKAELNEEYYQLAKYFMTLKQFRVIIFSTSKELYDEINESKEEEEQRSLIETFRRFIGKENENNFQLQSANNVINELIQKQQDLEFQMETEFSRYSKYLKDFKSKADKRINFSGSVIDDSVVSDSDFTRSNVPSQSTPQAHTRGGPRKSSFASGAQQDSNAPNKPEHSQQYVTFRNNDPKNKDASK